MKLLNNSTTLLSFIIVLLFCNSVFGQVTKVSGTISDAKTKQVLAFSTISINNGKTVAISDEHGRYNIFSLKPFDKIKVTCVGYEIAVLNVIPGKTQVIDIPLQGKLNNLEEIVIKSGKKIPYHNRDNPAVELIRQVINHKNQNRPENYSYLQYKEYGKLLLSFANVSPDVSQKKFWKKYKFLLDNRDTTLVPGKSLLPVYLDEKLTQNYYRKNPEKKKTIILAQKNINQGYYVDNEGLAKYFRHLYYDVDIYTNNIYLLAKLFLSPIADASPTFYKFFITDTLVVNNTKVVELSFTPRNANDLLFDGKIYVTLDGNYAVQKAILYTSKKTNINYVKDMRIDLDFEQGADQRYHLGRSNILVDFGLNRDGKGGMIGTRTATIKDYVANKRLSDSTYLGQSTILSAEANNRSNDYWLHNRLDTLTTSEAKIYHNIDTLKSMPSYRRTMDIATIIISGYKSLGLFEIGPIGTFYSFNPIEGTRVRFGGRTSPLLSKRYYFETYGAYGFTDHKYKYFLSGTWSLKDKSVYDFPQDYLRGVIQQDTRIPGKPLQFVGEGNPLLSFKRGTNDKYLYNNYYHLDYVHEFENHFSYAVSLKNLTQSPAGSLNFINYVNGLPNQVKNLTSTEATLTLRYAPNEEFYQGRIKRIIIPNKSPTFTFDFTEGFKNILGSSYSYQNLHFKADKHLYLSQLGYADVSFEAGHIFGQLPFPLLTIHAANQTYGYDVSSYNLMNFLEFVSDHYESINYEQHLNGVIFNKIPLFKKLKWRETVSFKALYGGVSDANNPTFHPSLYSFPVDANGRPVTYSLGNTPYMEGSVGIENIFKFFGFSLVRRFTYLDHPDVAKWGIRTKLDILF